MCPGCGSCTKICDNFEEIPNFMELSHEEPEPPTLTNPVKVFEKSPYRKVKIGNMICKLILGKGLPQSTMSKRLLIETGYPLDCILPKPNASDTAGPIAEAVLKVEWGNRVVELPFKIVADEMSGVLFGCDLVAAAGLVVEHHKWVITSETLPEHTKMLMIMVQLKKTDVTCVNAFFYNV